jgi:hypothetical protein
VNFSVVRLCAFSIHSNVTYLHVQVITTFQMIHVPCSTVSQCMQIKRNTPTFILYSNPKVKYLGWQTGKVQSDLAQVNLRQDCLGCNFILKSASLSAP